VRNGKRRLSSTIILLVTLFLLLAATPAFAYLYRAPVAITENASTSYDMLPVLWDQNNTWLASNGFMNSTANDTRVQTLGGLNKPHMVADNKTLTAIPVPASSQTNLCFVTGESELSAFDIIVGYDGYFTVDDTAAIELGDNFTIEQSGWVDTDNATDKNLVYKQGAFRTSVSPTVSGDITSGIFEWVTPTADGGVWTNPGNAYDNNTVSKATLNIPGGPVWSDPLTLTIPATMADAVEFYCSRSNPAVTQIRVEVFYGGGWNNIFEGAWTADIWEVKEIPAGTQSVTQIRISEYNSAGGIAQGDINEVKVGTYLNTSVTATGVTSGEHTVKTQMVDNTGAGWLAGWDNRMRFDVDADQVDANLTWFPTLVKLSSSCSIGNDDVTAIFDELGANHLKLAITESDGTTEMYVEVEKWDNGAEEAWLWTSSNTTTISSSTDTTFYLYYDNDHADNVAHVGVPNDAVAENVWDANFMLVDHMQDDPNNAATRDSTSNNNDGTKTGANEPIEATGKVGDAQDFDAINDEITILDNPSLYLGGSFTQELLVKIPADIGADQMLLCKDDAGANREWVSYYRTATKKVEWATWTAGGNVGNSQNTIFPLDTWHQIVFRYDGTDMRTYMDGVLDCSPSLQAGLLTNTAATFERGARNAAQLLDGLMDEIRMSNTDRSAAWIKATYHSCWDNFIDFIPDADGDLDEFALDFSILIDGTEEDRTPGVAVPDNANGWTFMQNNVMPYADNIKIETDGVLQAWYEPNDIIAGTTLPDRAGGDNPGTFSWGSNPSNVGASLGSMSSSGQPSIGATSDTSTHDILPVTGGTDWRPDTGVSPTLQANPLRPIVTAVSDNTTLSEYQVWVWLGIIFVVFVTVLVGANVRGHHLITGIAASAAIILLVVLTIFPWLSLLAIVLVIWGGLVSGQYSLGYPC